MPGQDTDRPTLESAMTRKQTSAKVSKLAAKYLAMDYNAMLNFVDSCDPDSLRAFLKDIRTLAASCLSQDEIKGSKPTVFKASRKFTKPREKVEEVIFDRLEDIDLKKAGF